VRFGRRKTYRDRFGLRHPSSHQHFTDGVEGADAAPVALATPSKLGPAAGIRRRPARGALLGARRRRVFQGLRRRGDRGFRLGRRRHRARSRAVVATAAGVSGRRRAREARRPARRPRRRARRARARRATPLRRRRAREAAAEAKGLHERLVARDAAAALALVLRQAVVRGQDDRRLRGRGGRARALHRIGRSRQGAARPVDAEGARGGLRRDSLRRRRGG